MNTPTPDVVEKRLNPEVVLAAKNMAEPYKYYYEAHHHDGAFNPLTRPADAHSLMLALMKDGFEFYFQNGLFWGDAEFRLDLVQDPPPGYFFGRVEDESFPLLLLRCVAAMNCMEIYV